MDPLAAYACDDADGRRQGTLAGGLLNGIDDVEVDTGHPDIPAYRTLLVRCLRPLPAGLRGDGVQVLPAAQPPNRPVKVTWAAPAPSSPGWPPRPPPTSRSSQARIRTPHCSWSGRRTLATCPATGW